MALATTILVSFYRGWLSLQQGARVWLTLSIEGDEADTESNAGDEEQEAPVQEYMIRMWRHAD